MLLRQVGYPRNTSTFWKSRLHKALKLISIISTFIFMDKRAYISSLKKYRPIGPWLCCDQPLFVVSQNWSKPFSCLIVVNIIFAMLILALYKWSGEDFKVYLLLDLITLSLFNVTYFLTQFMSPGVLYRPQISGLQNRCYQYCQSCRMYLCKQDGEQHCGQCGVCVYGMDHHCGWFQRCISGPSRFGFYFFMICTFGLVVAFTGSFLGISS